MTSLTTSRGNKRLLIKKQVRAWIRDGELEAGDPLPSQNELAKQIGVSAVTVHKALSELSDEGVLHRRQGSGTFVGPAPTQTQQRSMCLVLPGLGLDRRDVNPDYWPHVQSVLRAFLVAAGERWTFTTRAAAGSMQSQEAAETFSRYDMVFFHFAMPSMDLARLLIRENIAPVVRMGLPIDDVPCLSIDHDPVQGARLGVERLCELGYERIGFIGSTRHWGDLAFGGYCAALAQYGQKLDDRRVIRIGEDRRAGANGADQMLERGLPCDAVFVDSDIRALGAVEQFRRAGVEIPSDLGVMGYYGLDHAVDCPPHLSTVRVPYERMIAEALTRAETDARRPTPIEHIQLIGDVILGDTTRPHSSGHHHHAPHEGPST